ncbi:MAG: tetratricopeptide repeat protein [Alphaproteobacteria bacterium]|nr:tetratricopeptide repeat protein [Alphaproteobacteria bacterium]MCB9929226.1 tetratricopeptide repeat protein [Alphaproteobacteria bacterium]
MSGMTDSYGFAMTTANPAAAEAFDAGARSFVAWRADAMAHLNAAIEADPEFPAPKLLKAWILHAARSEKFHPAVRALLAEVEPYLGDASSREQAMARAVATADSGHLQGGVSQLETHLAEHPTDLLVHRLAQFELFWSGESRWMRDIVERAAPAWTEDTLDYGHFLAVRAFSNEEAGDYAMSERCGRGAVEREPESAWGAHAVAHTLVMQGRADEGASFLGGLSCNWGRVNQIAHHCWWHLCLFLLERNEYDRILELLDTKVRNPNSPLVQAMPDATIDLQNVASLLMRLELRGVDVGERWNTIAEICAGRVHDHANPFSSAHDAMALAAVGRFDLVETLVAGMRQSGSAVGTIGAVTQTVGAPVVEAMAAHRAGDYGKVVDLIWPVRRDLHQVGGSHAQRDVFFQMLVDAAVRAGRKTEIGILLDDIASIGFEQVAGRSLYREAAAGELAA